MLIHAVNASCAGAEPGKQSMRRLDRRGYVPVSEKMEVLDKSRQGQCSNVFCIGDANGAQP